MSTVATRKAGRRRYSGSSTATMGNGVSPEKSHSQLAQTMLNSVGWSESGRNAKDSGLKSCPHHGQPSRGIGAGLPSGLFLYWLTLLRAESERLSPRSPSRLGVPALPTHRPISNGHSPYRPAAVRRSSSRAHTRLAARPSWSRVSSRRV